MSNREKTAELECLESVERRGSVDKLGFRPGFWKRGLCWRQEPVSHGCEGGGWSWRWMRSLPDISGSSQ